MAWTATVRNSTAFGGLDASFFYGNPAGTFTEVAVPSGVNVAKRRASKAVYNGEGISRLCIVGGFTDNLVFTEHMALLRMGIEPMSNEIIAGAGSGDSIGIVASAAPGFTGDVIAYLTWWDDLHQRRSPLSGASPTLTLTNDSVTLANLPTTCVDPSVTHIECWFSIDGATPRWALRRQLGAASIVVSMVNGALGEAFDEDFEKFPPCQYNAIYHERQWMAGNFCRPDLLFYSALNEPERYTGYLRTRSGAAIVGLLSIRDQLLVFTEKGVELVQGFTEDDFRMDGLEPDIILISHHGIATVHGLAFVPCQQGLYLCTGSSFHYISEEFKDTWEIEYRDNRASYETGLGVVNQQEKVYQFFPGCAIGYLDDRGISHEGAWVIDYQDLVKEVGGQFGVPHLSFDVQARSVTCAANLAVPGAKRSDLYVGSTDGYVYKAESEIPGAGGPAADDQSDTFKKEVWIVSRHDQFGEFGGDKNDGWKFPFFWTFLESEYNAWTMSLYSGEEQAWKCSSATYALDFPAGQQEFVGDPSTLVYEPRGVYNSEPGISGRGLTAVWRVQSPLDWQWRGFGGTLIEGPCRRGVIETSIPG